MQIVTVVSPSEYARILITSLLIVIGGTGLWMAISAIATKRKRKRREKRRREHER